ncbi:MAG: LysM domain-containing protein, partial [Chloroflexota bacterium]
MGYWGWRPLICGVFISTWVVGCNIVTDYTAPSAAPSGYPDVTLTVGRLPTAQVSSAPTRGAPTRISSPQPNVQLSPTAVHYVVLPGDTLGTIAERFRLSIEALVSANDGVMTLTPGAILLIPTPTALQLNVQPPTCYETSPTHLLCLGRVDNPLDYSVENVTVEVSLTQADGLTEQTKRTTVEQMIIPAGSFAPYQASFSGSSSEIASVNARLNSATRSSENPTLLLIEDVEGELLDGRVVVSAVIYNPGEENTEILRVFVTLLDGLDRVIGYRVLTFERQVVLSAGENFPMRRGMASRAIRTSSSPGRPGSTIPVRFAGCAPLTHLIHLRWQAVEPQVTQQVEHDRRAVQARQRQRQRR